MRLEHIPLIIGVIVALIGLGFIADASMAAATPPTPERRRRERAEPSRAGEALVGVGTLCMAAALFGRDTWRYGTVAVLAGSIPLLIGIVLNRGFLKEALLFRGPARRAEGGSGAGATSASRPGQRGASRPGKPVQPPVVLGGRTPRPETGGSTPAGPSSTPAASPPSKPVASVRHPTPPLASPAYRPPEAATPQPAPALPRPAPATDAIPPRPRAAGPGDPPGPAAPPSGPKERRKSPRGKK